MTQAPGIDLETQASIVTLLADLHHEHKWLNAVEKLSRIGLPAVQPLIGQLADPKVDVFATDALIRIGRPAQALLLEALSGSQAGRDWVAYTLGWIGDQTALDGLKAVMQEDKEPFVRQSARDAINRIKRRTG